MNARSLWCLIALTWACSGERAAAPLATSAKASAPVSHAADVGARQREELRVGTSGDYAPFSLRDGSGRHAGFDVELAEALAADLGLQLRWVPFRWPLLTAQLQREEFDVAMGGVTWQPKRAVLGYLSRAVARGGPCVLGDSAALLVAVNRGGVLEAWARERFTDRKLVTVDDNMSLPDLLDTGRVGAVVTDSFELRTFQRPGWPSRCEPALTRKVYWIVPSRGAELGERIDQWLSANSARVQAAQERWFGERQRLDAATHLVDMLARRFAFMPMVAALKAEKGLPIEDVPREREVLAAVARQAAKLGLPEQPVLSLFSLTIELSKAVQRRQSERSDLDLALHIRPALTDLGRRILQALVEARSEGTPAVTLSDLELLSPWLTRAEREQMLAHLRAVAG